MMNASQRSTELSTDVIIVGAGFSGLGMAIRLQQLGHYRYEVLEKADRVGGTWRENTYPGVACDVQSQLYSFSFALNPDWSRSYSGGAEICAYLQACAEKFGVMPQIRFQAKLTGARWDGQAGCWYVEVEGQPVRTCRFLVLATGPLHHVSIPQLEGAAQFQGPHFHSAHWDHSVELRGKRVAVIGTGASAIQFVPEVVKQAVNVQLWQRTPPWILPKYDRPVSSLERILYRWVPGLQRLHRGLIYALNELRVLGFDLYPSLMQWVEKLAIRHLEQQVSDPNVRQKLTPSYRMGCKRILVSNDYYPAVSQPHVSVHTEGISRILPHGIVGQDGVEHPADVLIYGTGFEVKALYQSINLVGEGGQNIQSRWQQGQDAYLGTMLSGFPNLFMLMGPNTGLGHSSVVFMAEAQIHAIVSVLERTRMRNGRSIAVRAEAQSRFNRELQKQMRHTVWLSGCMSWYLDEKGINRTLWPDWSWRFWWRTRRLMWADFVEG